MSSEYSSFRRNRQNETKPDYTQKRSGFGSVNTESAKKRWTAAGNPGDYETAGMNFVAFTDKDTEALQGMSSTQKISTLALWAMTNYLFGEKISFAELRAGGIKEMDFADTRVFKNKIVCDLSTMNAMHLKFIEHIASITSSKSNNPAFEYHCFDPRSIDDSSKIAREILNKEDLFDLMWTEPCVPLEIKKDESGKMIFYYYRANKNIGNPQTCPVLFLQSVQIKNVDFLQIKQTIATADQNRPIKFTAERCLMPCADSVPFISMKKLVMTADQARDTMKNILKAAGFSVQEADKTKGLRDAGKKHVGQVSLQRSAINPSASKFNAPGSNRASILAHQTNAKKISDLKQQAPFKTCASNLQSARSFIKPSYYDDPNGNEAVSFKNTWSQVFNACAKRMYERNKPALKNVAMMDPISLGANDKFNEIENGLKLIDEDQGMEMPFIGLTTFLMARRLVWDACRADQDYKTGSPCRKSAILLSLAMDGLAEKFCMVQSQARTHFQIYVHEIRQAFGMIYEPVELFPVMLGNFGAKETLYYYDCNCGTLEFEGYAPSGMLDEGDILTKPGRSFGKLQFYPEKSLLTSKSDVPGLFCVTNFNARIIPKGNTLTRTVPFLKKPEIFPDAFKTRVDELNEGINMGTEVEGSMKMCQYSDGKEVQIKLIVMTSPEARGLAKFIQYPEVDNKLAYMVALQKALGVKFDDEILQANGINITPQIEAWVKARVAENNQWVADEMKKYTMIPEKPTDPASANFSRKRAHTKYDETKMGGAKPMDHEPSSTATTSEAKQASVKAQMAEVYKRVIKRRGIVDIDLDPTEAGKLTFVDFEGKRYHLSVGLLTLLSYWMIRCFGTNDRLLDLVQVLCLDDAADPDNARKFAFFKALVGCDVAIEYIIGIQKIFGIPYGPEDLATEIDAANVISLTDQLETKRRSEHQAI